ncbi:MAG: hypothetical protein K0U98_21010 [Deltaproteobacteria bacterium]|nr:hypothetical protein [Deltaproteobacteria bacterium]
MFEHQYVATFLCGRAGGARVDSGRYLTTINVFNPSNSEVVEIRWRATHTQPSPAMGLRRADPNPPPVSGFSTTLLGPGEALEIGCSEMAPGVDLATNLDFGFLEILSHLELDVVAVYSGGEPDSALSVERVPGRRRQSCQPLLQPLHTGTADWWLLEKPGHRPEHPQLAPTVPNPPAAWSHLPATQWISSQPDAMGVRGIYRFGFSFLLCRGFEKPSLDFELLSDNGAKIFLNGTKVAETTAGRPFEGSALPVTVADPGLFKAGWNPIEVVIENDGATPTGVAVNGLLKAERAQVPAQMGPGMAQNLGVLISAPPPWDPQTGDVPVTGGGDG